MADAYKILYVNQLPAAAANLYAPASLKAGIIKNITAVNLGANTETVTLYVNGVSAAFQWASFVLSPTGQDGASAEWDSTLSLTNPDFIAGKSTDATVVTVVISGDEVS